MEAALRSAEVKGQTGTDKRRLLWITTLAVAAAVVIGFIAKAMVLLIDLITNIAFRGSFTFAYVPPGDNHLGWWVALVPAVGGAIVGVMALYGSKAIRGHGIPEAMEMILTNQSKIRPVITYLKPLSAAISIGTGGPFGAEGPIISTGGALGSMVGQLLRISPNERKVLLAAGATAGMSAIFGSPIAAIFLAIELLLFEFAPRSLLPVVMGCITGAAMHHLLFGGDPMFAMPAIAMPGNDALFLYSVIGLLIGLLSLLITKAVYWIEDGFEKLPIHWMWWPAIGGLAVGIIGYFFPRTLGVGYENITELLSGNAPMHPDPGAGIDEAAFLGHRLGQRHFRRHAGTDDDGRRCDRLLGGHGRAIPFSIRGIVPSRWPCLWACPPCSQGLRAHCSPAWPSRWKPPGGSKRYYRCWGHVRHLTWCPTS
jgi:CIC family chloride channel protein